ncbi:TPA: hypothetical protein PL572_000182 [Cronobacter turicensis]|nr:hypothetical protein [Cronobacter turicensis]
MPHLICNEAWVYVGTGLQPGGNLKKASTALQSSNVTFERGIEAFEGTHMVMFLDCTLTATLYFLNDYFYASTAGSQGATAAMDSLMARTTPLIGSSARAFYFTNGARNSLTLINRDFLGTI